MKMQLVRTTYQVRFEPGDSAEEIAKAFAQVPSAAKLLECDDAAGELFALFEVEAQQSGEGGM
ncbi:hypothetical protein EP7_004319 [Isosphaeraceae bacterium EP7]